MLSLISFHAFGVPFAFPTQWLLFSLIPLGFFFGLRRGLPAATPTQLLALTLVPMLAAFPGGMLLDAVSVAHPEEGGQAYYGALLFQSAIFWLVARLMLAARDRASALDAFAILSGFVYFMLRLNCFANGCCYGKLCPYPWAVVFRDEHALTPFLGMPLHPTQLYFALHGLAVGVSLLVCHRRFTALRGKLFSLFLILMPLGRLGLEPFRMPTGDPLWHGAPATTWISLALLMVGVAALARHRFAGLAMRVFARSPLIAALALFCLLTSGCMPKLPKPPGVKVVTATETLAPGVFSHHMALAAKSAAPAGRNLFFAAVDDEPEDATLYQSFLAQLYGKHAPRMEDVLWWRYAPVFVGLYNEVVRVDYASFDKETLALGLARLEKEGLPYDVVLTVHGIPNHLISSRGKPVITWQDIDAYSGANRLEHIGLVFLQACYGDSLKDDWLTAGAHGVISWEGIHSNFFFYDIFLEFYAAAFASGLVGDDNAAARQAFAGAVGNFKKELTHNSIYKHMVEMLFGAPAAEYSNEVEMPRLILRH